MVRLLFLLVTNVFALIVLGQQHPITFITKAEATNIKNNIKIGLLQKSFNEVKKEVDAFVDKDVDVPFPKDPAGGYTHDKHKSNYTLMFNSGLLYNITGEAKYALLVKNMLLKYAILNPTLKNHPQATSSSPGRLFWQALNDANWMVYAGIAYDLIQNSLTLKEKQTIENGAFKPEVEYFTKDLKNWFNLLHNHAVWACAGVGLIGIATNNKDYIDMALYGTEKNGKAGFIAQMNSLFSPDGYYTEGPYYVRYAILPYMLFANALNNNNPDLKIFELRNKVLYKALETCLQQTNLDGTFFPLNDAIKEKDFTSNELVTAISIARKVYGANAGMLTVAKKQNRVVLHQGSVMIAKELLSTNALSNYYPYKTIESTDGIKGNEGGIGVLRNGKDANLTSLIFKYASHGLSHGHFDKLNINIFDKGEEILQDYGSARFIGIEQKYGGRYLPENTTYAAQTIAHNTIVADEKSHFNGDGDLGQKYHSDKLFSDFKNPNALAIAAKDDNVYKNIGLQRNLYMLDLPEINKIIIDIFNVKADDNHQYDLPFQYNGQVINTTFKYNSFKNNQETLGKKNGYQFLWKQAEAHVTDSMFQFTYLKGNSFYTISSKIQDSGKVFFTMLGANDPNFNLRQEPSYIIRTNGTNKTFVNVIEIHGKYDRINEFSSNSYSTIKNIEIIKTDKDYTIAEIMIGTKKILVAQANLNFESTKAHNVYINGKEIIWIGPYKIFY